MSQHKTGYVISYHGILCHDMSYVTTIVVSLTQVCTHIPTRKHAHTYPHVSMHTHPHMHAHTHAHTHTHTHAHAHTHTHTHTHTNTHTHVRTHTTHTMLTKVILRNQLV